MEITLGHRKEAAEGKEGMFAKKKEASGGNMAALSEQIMALTRRMRVLEEQQTNTRRKLQMIEQNMLSMNKRASDEIKTINSDIVELRRLLAEVEGKILLIIKELKETARKEDVDVLQKYINLWEPVNFVTKDELEKVMKERAEDE